MKAAFKHLLIITLIITTASCGFRLRGTGESYALPPELLNLDLTGSNLNSELMYQVQNNLNRSGVTVNGPGESLYVLNVIDQGVNERNTTFSSDARATEKEIKARASFTLKSKDGEFIYGPHNLSTERVYDYDVGSVNSADREKQLIVAELRRNLADQILRMVQAVELPSEQGANVNQPAMPADTSEQPTTTP